ncbi:MAG: polyphosphate polymerase domain-containing protein [candidate division WOR-3 bacterium]
MKPTPLVSGRLEYKYVVPKSLLPELRAALRPYVCLDGFCAACPAQQYTVRSIYYDNRRLSCYDEKFDGFRLKKKLRIRGYNQPGPDSTVFLEIKRKQEDFISKSRAPVRWDQIEQVFAGYGRATELPFAPGSAEAEAAGRFLYNYYRRRMMPLVLVAYEREAFFGRFDPRLRLTFDRNIRSRLYPRLAELYVDRDLKFLIPGHFVFEVKFYMTLPQWVRSVVQRFDLQRTAFSKFALGIDVHRVEKKELRNIGHTVEFPDSPVPLEKRRLQTWVNGVLLEAGQFQPRKEAN